MPAKEACLLRVGPRSTSAPDGRVVDLLSVAFLAIFGAAAVGGVIGFLVARVSRFEIGLGVGLLIFGAVAFYFSVRCLIEYRAFAYAGPNALWGEVIAIEDRAVNESGSITTPVPIVRFTTPDDKTYTVSGPSGGSAKVGSHVNVVLDRAHPERSRIGEIGEFRGGAIAMMLFGTFPSSFGLWMLFAYRGRTCDSVGARARDRRVERSRERSNARRASGDYRNRIVVNALGCGMVGAILWIGVSGADLLQRFAEGFGAVALLMTGYALWGATAGRAGTTWSLGMLVLAVNFGVWALALYLLL